MAELGSGGKKVERGDGERFGKCQVCGEINESPPVPAPDLLQIFLFWKVLKNGLNFNLKFSVQIFVQHKFSLFFGHGDIATYSSSGLRDQRNYSSVFSTLKLPEILPDFIFQNFLLRKMTSRMNFRE